jgi:hypothetical protein
MQIVVGPAAAKQAGWQAKLEVEYLSPCTVPDRILSVKDQPIRICRFASKETGQV